MVLEIILFTVILVIFVHSKLTTYLGKDYTFDDVFHAHVNGSKTTLLLLGALLLFVFVVSIL